MKNLEKKRAEAEKLKVNLAVQEKVIKTLRKRLNTTKSLDDLNERAAELERETAEGRAIIADENTSPSERAAAEERVAGRDEELVPLRTQIEARERAMPPRERIKEIFKKYGVTVTAIFLAADLKIGAVIGSITNSLKATGKALGNGLQVRLRCCHRLLLQVAITRLPAMKAVARATEDQLIPDSITLRVAIRHLLVRPSDQYSLRAHFFNSPPKIFYGPKRANLGVFFITP